MANQEELKRKAILYEYHSKYGIKDLQDLKKIAMLRAAIESKKIDDVMDTDFPKVDANDSLVDTLKLMQKSGYQDIPVLDGDSYVGTISYGAILKKKSVALSSKVKDSISYPPIALLGMTITEVAELMVINNSRQVPVVDSEKKLIGCIGRNEMIKLITNIDALSELKIWEIMTSPAESIKVNATFEDVLSIMRPVDIRTVPVVNDSNNVVGIVGMREVIESNWQDSNETIWGDAGNECDPLTIGSICKTVVKTIEWNDPVKKAIELMSAGSLSTLPVLDSGVLVGIITQYDIVQLISACKERNFMFVQMSGLDDADKEYSVEINETINNAMKKIGMIGIPGSLFVNVSKYKEHGDRKKYSINAKLIFNGRTVSAKHVDWDIVTTMNGVMRKLIDMIINEKDIKLSFRKRAELN